MIKWVLGLMVAGAVILTGFKLVPVYIDNHALSEVMSDVLRDNDLKSRPKRDVISKLQGHFRERNLTHLDPKEIVKVARDSNGGLVLDVKYEERRKLLYNLEIVAGFDEQFTN